MLSEFEALRIVRNNFPESRIERPIDYLGLYVFPVFSTDPLETGQDPFFSVNIHTGELRDFSVISDGDPKEIEAKFLLLQTSKK